MKALVCEKCGGPLKLRPDTQMAVCEFCGTAYYLGADEQVIEKRIREEQQEAEQRSREAIKKAEKARQERLLAAEAKRKEENNVKHQEEKPAGGTIPERDRKKNRKRLLFICIFLVGCLYVSHLLEPKESGKTYDSTETAESPSVTESSETAAENETEQTTEQNTEDTTLSWEEQLKAGIRSERLNGRGRADSGRNEPAYLNVIGYAVTYYKQDYAVEKTNDFQNADLWVVPTYKKDKQFWVEAGTLPHKTEVIVREQMLKHEKYGQYSGYLLVEKTDDGSQYYINVENYVTKPYWTYQTDLREAAMTGNFVAEYRQVSDYYPVDSGGDKLEIPDGTRVLVTGITSSLDSKKDKNTGIEAIVWKNWKLGYGGVKCSFNEEDLTIIY